MNVNAVQENIAGKWVNTPTGYRAFLPNPLPPPLDYSTRLVRAISEADRALGELRGVGSSLSNPHLLIRPFIRREAVLSSRIEGTRASLEDVYAFEAIQLPLFETGGDVREVHNYATALEYGLKRLEALPLSLRLLREIHSKLMEGVRGEYWTPGEFRRSQNWIGGPGSTIETAVYIPPTVAEMQRALADLENFFHESSDLPPLLRIGLIHYQFEAIHPFLDGNGRIGRLLIILLLCAWDLLPHPLLYLSDYFDVNRQTYYAYLLGVSQMGAWENWLVFFLDGVTNQSKEAIIRIGKVQQLHKQYYSRLQEKRTSARLLQMIDLLFTQPIVTVRQVENNLGISYLVALRYVEQLTNHGILREVTGKARNRVWQADEILAVLK